MRKLKIAIIESGVIHLDKFKDIFNRSTFAECIMAVDSIEKFLKYQQPFMQLDLLFLADELNGISSMERIGKIKQAIPDTAIIMLGDKAVVKTIIKALRLGATGYLLKKISVIELDRQLILIKEGGVALSPTIGRIIIEYFSPQNQLPKEQKKHRLSNKEQRITNLLVEGLTYKEISNNLHISVDGVRYHIKNIYNKLNVNSRSEIYKKIVSV